MNECCLSGYLSVYYIYRILEDCNGNVITEPDNIFHLSFTPYSSPAYLLRGAKSVHFNAEALMMRINPIVCFSGRSFSTDKLTIYKFTFWLIYCE